MFIWNDSSVLKHNIFKVGGEIFCNVPASLLLDSSKVESGFNKVDAEDKGRSGMDKGLRLLLVLFITGFRVETKNGFLC